MLLQEPQPREIIVIDDGSTDGTAEIARATSSAVTVVQKANGGEASARNAGLHAAAGDWVAYLDADDRYLPGRLAAIGDLIRIDPAADVITANGFLEVAGTVVGTCYGPLWTFPASDHRREILRRNFVLGHVVARRSLLLDLGGFDETIKHTTDWEMWIRVVFAGGQIRFVDLPLSVYRLHATSLSADRVAMVRGGLATLKAAASRVDLSEDERAVVAAGILDHQSRAAREALSRALLARDVSTARSAAFTVVLSAHHSSPARLQALAAVIAPRASSAYLRMKRRDRGVGATGRYVPLSERTAVNGGAERPQPMVSVILPFLDEERFLAGAIETVSNQTMESWELLLVDDGSCDASGAIADRAAAERPDRVRVLRHPGGANRGLAASRNLGIEHAVGGAIAFLDADDRWEPEKLDRQLRLLAEHPEVAMVCGPTWHRFVNTEEAPVRWPVSRRAPGVFGRGVFARELARETVVMPPPPSAVMYRTSMLREVVGYRRATTSTRISGRSWRSTSALRCTSETESPFRRTPSAATRCSDHSSTMRRRRPSSDAGSSGGSSAGRRDQASTDGGPAPRWRFTGFTWPSAAARTGSDACSG